ncbi:MAG: GGDEF domain-containing protein [Acidimicrobiia bacterium]
MLQSPIIPLSPESVLAGLSDVVVAIDTDGTVAYASPSVRSALGWEPAQVTGRTVTGLIDRRDRRRACEAFGALTRGIPVDEADDEPLVVRIRTASGDAVWMHVSFGRVDAATSRFVVASARAAADQWREISELARHARTDPLTGVWNRRGLEVESRRYEAGACGPCAVLICDLDDFKSINDRFGHQAGDHVLVEVTRRLSTPLRTGDTLARIGGDEFVILLDAIDDDASAVRACARIADAVRTPIALPVGFGTVPISLSVSIGAALTGGRGSLHEWLAAADTALYESKGNGKDQAVVTACGRYEADW